MSTETILRLNQLLQAEGMEYLDEHRAERFTQYLNLLLRWNAKTNLTAIRDEEGILSRHFLESIACAWALPSGIGSLLDFGSGGGFPGIPIAICRPEIQVTLAESQGKKVAFLREAVRVLELSTEVYGNRAETIEAKYDCVTLRAVDRMEEAVHGAGTLVAKGGFLAVMTTESTKETLKEAAGLEFTWLKPLSLPGGLERVLLMGKMVCD